MPKRKAEDFRKLKAKVGKKAKRINETVVNVKTRKIFLPNQNNISESKVSGESRLQHYILQCKHHNPSMRKDGVKAIETLVEQNREILHKDLVLVIESSLSLLLDDDQKVQESCRSLLSFIWKNVLPSELTPFAQLFRVHIRGAITHLSSSIRISALKIIENMLEFAPSILLSGFQLDIIESLANMLKASSRASGARNKTTVTTSRHNASKNTAGEGTGALKSDLRVLCVINALLKANSNGSSQSKVGHESKFSTNPQRRNKFDLSKNSEVGKEGLVFIGNSILALRQDKQTRSVWTDRDVFRTLAIVAAVVLRVANDCQLVHLIADDTQLQCIETITESIQLIRDQIDKIIPKNCSHSIQQNDTTDPCLHQIYRILFVDTAEQLFVHFPVDVTQKFHTRDAGRICRLNLQLTKCITSVFNFSRRISNVSSVSVSSTWNSIVSRTKQFLVERVCECSDEGSAILFNLQSALSACLCETNMSDEEQSWKMEILSSISNLCCKMSLQVLNGWETVKFCIVLIETIPKFRPLFANDLNLHVQNIREEILHAHHLVSMKFAHAVVLMSCRYGLVEDKIVRLLTNAIGDRICTEPLGEHIDFLLECYCVLLFSLPSLDIEQMAHITNMLCRYHLSIKSVCLLDILEFHIRICSPQLMPQIIACLFHVCMSTKNNKIIYQACRIFSSIIVNTKSDTQHIHLLSQQFLSIVCTLASPFVGSSLPTAQISNPSTTDQSNESTSSRVATLLKILLLPLSHQTLGVWDEYESNPRELVVQMVLDLLSSYESLSNHERLSLRNALSHPRVVSSVLSELSNRLSQSLASDHQPIGLLLSLVNELSDSLLTLDSQVKHKLHNIYNHIKVAQSKESDSSHFYLEAQLLMQNMNLKFGRDIWK